MYQAIHYDDHGPMTDPCRYLRRHDLVYRRPALRPYDGVPVGTGDAGGLLYQTAYGLELTVNHTDALDYAPDGAMQAWAWEAEERQTAPVSCGHLSIRSTLPIFDWVYLEAFEQRLILSTASIEGRAKTPFAEASWKLYAPREPDVLVLELEIEQTEEAALEIQIDKWPSPSFFHHYEQILDIHDKNLYCVRAEANRDALLVTQALRRCRTALAVSCGGEPEQLNSHAVCCRFPKQKRHRLTLYLAARASAEASVRENTLAALTAAKDAPSLWQTHCRYWQDFWSRSFLHLQENDYLENLCYLHLYQMGCGNLGKNPLTFAGLWGWFRDARNWGHFYHWNHQQNYWGLYAVGHGELCENYLDYRFRMLPHTIADTKRLFGVEGAFYSDISNLNGFQAIEPDTVRNLSVGAQIALDFYRRVRYQPDEVFLRERALPVMTACAEFYQNLLELRGGVLQLRGGSTAFESYWNLEQNLVDQVLLRALFHALLTLNDAYALDLDAAGYQAVLDRLPPLQTETVLHNGEALEIFCVGQTWSHAPVQYAQGEYPLSPFPAALLAPVWPSGWIGLDDAGSRLFAIMRNTARVVFDRDVYQIGKLGCCGHTPSPETAARLGMREDAERILHHFISSYQLFPNSLMHFADITQAQQWSAVDRPQILPREITATQWEQMHEKAFGNRTQIPSEWFLHCYFEAAANLFAGTLELLLQSRGGVIYVFPALAEARTAMFTLWAEDGFRVTSECANGDIRYIAVESTRGGLCRVCLPWTASVCIRTGHTEAAFTLDGKILSFETAPDTRYLIFRREFPPENYYHNPFPYHINEGKKTFDRASLGLSAYY